MKKEEAWKRTKRVREKGEVGACASSGGRVSSSLLDLGVPSPSCCGIFSPRLSLGTAWSRVHQVARPPIGGRERRCAWVGEAWCMVAIGPRSPRQT